MATKKTGKAKKTSNAQTQAVSLAKELKLYAMPRRRASYDDSCMYAERLHFGGLSLTDIVHCLRDGNWPTKNGGQWWRQNAQRAATGGLTTDSEPKPSRRLTSPSPAPRRARAGRGRRDAQLTIWDAMPRDDKAKVLAKMLERILLDIDR